MSDWQDLSRGVLEEFASASAWQQSEKSGGDDGHPRHGIVRWKNNVGSGVALEPQPSDESDLDSLVIAREIEEYRRRLRLAVEELARPKAGYKPVEHPYLVKTIKADAERERRLVSLLEERGPLNRRQAFVAIGGFWFDFLRTWQAVCERRPELVDPALPTRPRPVEQPKTAELRTAIIALLEQDGTTSIRAACRATGGVQGTVQRIFAGLRSTHPHLFTERGTSARGATRSAVLAALAEGPMAIHDLAARVGRPARTLSPSLVQMAHLGLVVSPGKEGGAWRLA